MEELKVGHTKPLAFIKVQTTGMDFKKDRIIELSIIKVEVDGKTVEGTRFVNPEMPIPAEATAVNNITDEMVKDKPTFKEMAAKMAIFLEGCDFVGFNIEKFDLRFLGEEFNRAGVEFLMLGRKIVDLSKIYHAMEPRDFSAAYNFYCGKKMAENSRSVDTTTAYFEIINSMFEKYSGKEYTDKSKKTHTIEPSIESAHKVFNGNISRFDAAGNIVANEQGRPIINFGVHKGKLVSEHMINNSDYYEWFLKAGGFPLDTVTIVKKIVERAKSATLAK